MEKMEIRGVVEGFYGKPWSWSEREYLLDFMGKCGYNLYIYGPKADPYHRSMWKEPYPKKYMDEFKKIVETGRENSVEVSVAVSPGLSLSYSNEKDFRNLLTKFLSFAEAGSRTFSLFLDDIPPELIFDEDKKLFDSLADAQSYFINKLYESIKSESGDIDFIFCPTHYHGTCTTDYHKTIGRLVNKNIKIMWTGPEVCSEKIGENDALMISQAYGRPVLYWDNYPVNDATMVPELHMGPYEGREPGIASCCCGIVLNPMNQLFASLIPLKAISYFLTDAESMTPEQATLKAVEEFAGGCEEQMMHFINSNIKSPLHRDYPTLLEDIRNDSMHLYKKGRFKDSVDLIMKSGNTIIENSESIFAHLDKKILADIEPWLEEYRLWGLIIRAIAEVRKADLAFYEENPYEDRMSEKLVDDAVKAGEKLEELVKTSISNRKDVFGNKGWEFAMETLKTNKGLIELFRF